MNDHSTTRSRARVWTAAAAVLSCLLVAGVVVSGAGLLSDDPSPETARSEVSAPPDTAGEVVPTSLRRPADRATTPAPADLDDHEGFLLAAYQGLLGREPDTTGQRHWISRFDDGVAPRVVLESFGTSNEHHRHLVSRAYERFLHRSPEPAGHTWWAARMGRTRAVTDLWSGLTASSEYYSTQGGGTPEGFVRALYRDILDRDPDPAGLTHWSAQVAAGAPRTRVARAVLTSPEAFRLSDLGVESASPAPGREITHLDTVVFDTDSPVMAEASTIIVTVDGRRVAGSIEADGTTLRFTATETPVWVPLGGRADVVVTAFGYDGDTVARADYTFALRRGPRPGRTDGQLPRGGTELFPDHLLVAFYGGTATPVLGVLGEGTPAEAGQRLLEQVRPYTELTDRTVLPVFELIGSIAHGTPTPSGDYTSHTPFAEIEPYLDAVRALEGMLVLDLQPGRARFIDHARHYEPFLVQPDVGLALDPEWSAGPGQEPGGGFIGTIDAAEINQVSAYLAELVATHDLPEKLLVVHRFTPGMVTNADQVVDREGVAIVFHADGFGSPESKLGDYHTLLPDRFERGMKLFYRQDTRVMTPAELLGLDPPPGFVSYQ
ncbi:MAG: DUF4214 domain-containing protein [Acidimicrobiales bacterium]